MPEKPNVLFICTDQQRWDTIGRYKPAALRTPHLDRLCAEGVHLPNTFCQTPVCIPSRCCMLTGQYPTQTGVYHNTGVLPGDKITWPRVLREHGYLTACVGRAHEIHQGFDWTLPVPIGDSYFDHNARLNRTGSDWSFGHYDFHFVPHIYEGDFEDFVATRAITTARHMMRDLADSHRPWAMYLGLLAPHNPYILPRKYADLYRDDDFDPPCIFEEDFTKPSYYNPEKHDVWKPYSEEHIRHTRRVYYSMITMVDELLGRLLEHLDELGLTDNTIILFTSDHGEMNGDHAMWAKINFYEESIRIPFLLWAPGLFPGGREYDALVESVDFMPTLLDLAGIASPASVAGGSVAPLLKGETTEHKEAVVSMIEEPGCGRFLRCLRTKRHRLSFGYPTPEGLTGELYDMENDPRQRTNLYDAPDHRDVRDMMMQRMLEREIQIGYHLHHDRPELRWRYPESFHIQ